MTLQQLRYVIALAEYGSFNEAAKNLFVSQPSLSNAVRELEEELGAELFTRTKKGVDVTADGYEFLESANYIVSSADQLLQHFQDKRDASVMRFSVSSLRYAFITRSFMMLLSGLPSSYDLALHEGSYQQVLKDVSSHNSEIGILNVSYTNSRYLPRQLKDNHLAFHVLYSTHTRILVNKAHPLCGRDSVSVEDLRPYPYLIYETEPGCPKAPVGESVFFNYQPKRLLRAQDRSTLNWLIRNTDGYSVIHGLLDEDLQRDLVEIPVNVAEDSVQVGWICHEGHTLSAAAKHFLELVQQEVAKHGVSPQ